MINKLLKIFSIMLVSLTLAFNSYSQNPTYIMEIKNDSLVSPTEYIFDFYIKNTSTNPSWATSWQLQGIQAGIKINSAILNGGTITPTIVAGFSDLLSSNQQTNANLSMQGLSTANYGLKMTAKAAGVGSGTMILTTEMRVCRIKLTNSVPYAVNSQPNFTWNFGTNIPWATKVTAFLPAATEITVQANHLLTNFVNPLLNTPPVKYNITGSGSYCQGSFANIGLSNSETGVKYQLYKNNSAIGTPVSGTGSSLTWSNNTFGNYFIIASRIATSYTDTMNGTAVLTETVGLPGNAGVISGNTTICQGNPGETYSVATISNVENYIWEYSGSGVSISGTTNTASLNFSQSASSGNLTVKGNNACGYGATSTPLSIVISNLPDAAGTISGSSTVSPGQTAVSYTVPAINGAITYTWVYSGNGATINGNSNSISIDFGSNATPGFLTVKGTNPCGSGTISSDFAINVNSVPGAAGSITGLATVCPGQNNVMYKVPEILGANTYLWQYSGTGVTIDSTLGDTAYINFSANATSGNLTVMGHNSFGYGTVSSNFAISINPFPVSAGLISGLDTVCKNTNNIIYTVPAIQNATSYTWTLPSGATGSSLTNTISVNFGSTASNGNITVLGNNVCGNGLPSNKAIVINTIPVGAGTISGLSPVCQGTNNLTYTVPQISGATSYLWTLPTGVTGSSTTNSITVNVSTTSLGGQITVKGTNACGNGTASAMSLTVNPLPSAAGVISGLNTVCQGQTNVTYTVPSITNATSYTWTKPNGTVGSSTTNSISISYSATASSGNITVKGNNSCGQGTISTLPITVNPLPDSALTITGLTTVCKGAVVVYKVNPVNNAVSYLWTLPTGVTGSSTNDSIVVTYTSAAVSGNISVNGVNACGNGVSKSIAITVNDVPVQAGSITGVNTVCQGQNNVTYSVPVISGATSYIWSLPSGISGSSTTNSITVNVASNAVSGNISVKGNNSCGDGLPSTLAITVNSIPDIAGTITGLTTVCQGQANVTFNVPTINNSTTYVWTPPAGATGTSTTNSITLSFATYAVSGNLKVKGQNACGFGQESTLAITVNPLPSNAGTITGTATVCKGQSNLTYTIATINNATTYEWTYPSGFTGSSNTNSITFAIGSTAVSGNITVKGQNSCGYGNQASKSITVNSVPSAPISITGNDTVCQGAQNQLYSVSNVAGATSYTWILNNGATGTSSTNSIFVNFLSPATSGNIIVKANNNCGSSDSIFKMITVNTIPNAAGTITGNTAVCQGATGVTYTVPAISGATSYIWTLPAGVSGNSLSNSITVSFASNATAGSISVKGSNICGEGTASSLSFTITAMPAAAGAITSVGGDSVSQAGVSKTYTVPAIANAISYIWSYSGTGATITGTTNTVSILFSASATSGILTVTGHNSCGDGTVSPGFNIQSYIGIDDPNGNSLSYSIYPNPTKGLITVNINGISSKLELQITNIQGEVIHTEKLANNKHSYSKDIDLSTYAKGVYFVKIINNNFVKVEKIVLQ